MARASCFLCHCFCHLLTCTWHHQQATLVNSSLDSLQEVNMRHTSPLSPPWLSFSLSFSVNTLTTERARSWLTPLSAASSFPRCRLRETAFQFFSAFSFLWFICLSQSPLCFLDWPQTCGPPALAPLRQCTRASIPAVAFLPFFPLFTKKALSWQMFFT